MASFSTSVLTDDVTPDRSSRINPEVHRDILPDSAKCYTADQTTLQSANE